jgi:peptidoglycan-N-acetylglucosamine deacetylase
MARENSTLAAPGCVVAALGVAAFFCAEAQARASAAPGAFPEPQDYPSALLEAVGHLELGEPLLARPALTWALGVDSNDPYGLLTLGVLSLHSGDGRQAEQALRRAWEQDPGSPLIPLGLAQARLLQRDLAGAAALASSDPNLSLYVRYLAGDRRVARELEDVSTEEPDPLRLELAGMAALRFGEGARGKLLLQALLARPEWRACEESPALILPFAESRPAEGCASRIEPIALPQPMPNTPVLTGTATLTPGQVPAGTSVVMYRVPGNYSATTNSAPFVASWNTARLTNGLYTLIVTACNSLGEPINETRRTVRIANASAPSALRLSREQRKVLETRLKALLTPQPSRKAAHYALAEWAVRNKDSAEALARIESVVAIDPQFRSAYASLKEYNKKYVGVGNGYWRGQTTQKLIALTLDDGPNPLKYRTPALLDTLRNLGVKATFFVVGARAEANPDLIRRMDAEGHELANHSYTHPNLTFLTPENVRRELCRTSVVVRDIIGKRPRFYRPPGGNFNGAIADAASALGMHGAYWTVDGFKFEHAPYRPEDVTRYVLKKVKPGSILLLHNAPENTILALPQIVKTLQAQGYEFVTMSELVHRSQALSHPQSPLTKL